MARTMSGRERVLAAISHKQPDMVPIDFSGLTVSSIVVEGYEKLKEHFGIVADTELCDRMMRVVKVDESILQALDIDTRCLYRGAPTTGLAEDLGPGKYRDEWGVERVRPGNSYYYDIENFRLSGDITVSDIINYPWPDPDDPGYVQGLRERLQWIREHTDSAAVLLLPAPFVHITQYLRGFEDWYCDFILNTKVLETLCDAVLEVTMQIARNILTEVGQDVDVVASADDLGTQSGLQMRYEHYVKYIKPRHARYFRQIHELSPCKLLMHSCGAVADIIDDLIDIGVDILNPVQVSATGMDPAELKARYRGRMAFWGGMETQKVLPTGSVDDVHRMVEQRIEQMGEGGGYVLTSVHNLQPDVPPENIVAMFRHAREYVPSFAT